MEGDNVVLVIITNDFNYLSYVTHNKSYLRLNLLIIWIIILKVLN